jgi:3-oxoacyl-[acyl-carrier-protein] synthase II
VEYLGDDYGGIFRAFDSAATLVRGDSPYQHCPFDESRSGFLFSEGGAGALVLESRDHAEARGAPLIASIGGFSELFDPYSTMNMDPEGTRIEALERDLLSRCGVSPSMVDYINSHGTATVMNDQIQASVIERVFGDQVAVNSTKALTGHTLGACGAIEAAVTALSIYHQKTHGSPFLKNPIRPLNFVLNSGALRIRTAVSQSFAFGGHNAALLLEKA